eukprot:252844_1
MGISRDSRHKRRPTGGRRKIHQKKRKHEIARPSAHTKIGHKLVRDIRTRGGNKKFRALRLETGNFSWGSENCTRKSRIIDVMYNASDNELYRTKTLVKNCIIAIDATPLRQWYEKHYDVKIGVKEGRKVQDEEATETEKIARSKHAQRKYNARQADRVLDPKLDEQFVSGRLLVCVSSRPGQSGRCDGYVLEGKELEFYKKKIEAKKRH